MSESHPKSQETPHTKEPSANRWLLWAFGLFLGVATVDFLAKAQVLELQEPARFGFLVVIPFTNAGVLGGYFSDLDPWIIRIFFSVLFGFICLGAGLLIHLLQHKRTPLLKWGIILYLSGVLGNSADRMIRGAVIDYLVLDLPGLRGAAFNFSDIVVLIGFSLVATAIFRERERIWFDGNQRQGYWIDPPFQKQFAALLGLIGFAHFLVIALYSFTFLKVYIGTPEGAATVLSPDRIITDYLIGLFSLEAAALILTLAVSAIFSHRLVGPIAAVELHIARVAQGNRGPLRLRKGDYFRERLQALARRFENQNPRE